MGGLGSGIGSRRSRGGRPLVETAIRLDVRRQVIPQGERRGLAPTPRGEQRVSITWTPCRFGGSRPWWCCPRCSRSCAVLYRGDDTFYACRKCWRLAYQSQRLDACERARLQARKLRRKLGGDEYGVYFPRRPAGMHLATYHRALWALNRYEERAAQAGLAGLNRLVEWCDALKARRVEA